MSLLPTGIGALSLFAEDLEHSKAFYRDVLELSVLYEDEVSTVFDFGNTIINLLQASEAPGLIAPATVADPEAGARFQLTIWVDDVDAACQELSKRGVELLNGPVDRPWGKRTAAFADPAGHVWELTQDIPQAEP